MNKINQIRKLLSVLCTLYSVLSISSCTDDSSPTIPQPDDLAVLPKETPVGITAEIAALQTPATRTASETYYADDEIHLTTEGIYFALLMPGGSDETWLSNLASIENLPNTEPFSTLQLKDFNLTEGGDRCVSRWTYLTANNGADYLFGFARLEAGADGKPVLDYGELTHACTKVTIKVVDSQGDPVPVADDNDDYTLEATLHFPFRTAVAPIYLTDEAGNGTLFDVYCGEGITTLAADKAITRDNIALAVFKNGDKPLAQPLYAMLSADGEEYYGEDKNELSIIVPPTATYTPEETAPGVSATRYFPIANPSFTGDEKLTITVKKDPDGDGPLTTGTYTLKLKDIRVESGKMTDESAEQNFPLSSFNSGTHYVITVTLDHNRLATGTAQLASWNYTEAEATLGGDPSALPTLDGSTTDREVLKAAILTAYEKNIPLILTGTTLATDGSISYFYHVSTNLVYYDEVPAGSIDLVLPDFTELPEYAFNDCEVLRSVSAPKVTTIGQMAFQSCSGLTSVDLPVAKEIGLNAFASCTALKSLELPAATTLGDALFGNAPLTSLTFGSVIESMGYTLGLNDAENCVLTLAAGQQQMEYDDAEFVSKPTGVVMTAAAPTASEEARRWAGCVWKEIIITPSTNE